MPLHCSMELGTLCRVEPVYKDHPGDQENVVSVDRWSSYHRGVSVWLRLRIGYFKSGDLGQMVSI